MVKSKFPMRLIDLLHVSRQVHDEVKDYLFRTITFKIDVRKDGTFMCGRRLLEPRREDGSSHVSADEVDHARRKFLKCFAWASVKNYTVDILLENWFHSGPQPPYYPANAMMNPRWDEEVELYDIRGQSRFYSPRNIPNCFRLHLCGSIRHPGQSKEAA